MTTIEQLLRELTEFEKAPQNAGYDLRLDLADIILRHLDGKVSTQKALARRAGMKESFITRIVHADSNCTFDVAGRILSALGVKGKLVEDKGGSISSPRLATGDVKYLSFGENYGKEKTFIVGTGSIDSTANTKLAG